MPPDAFQGVPRSPESRGKKATLATHLFDLKIPASVVQIRLEAPAFVMLICPLLGGVLPSTFDQRVELRAVERLEVAVLSHPVGGGIPSPDPLAATTSSHPPVRLVALLSKPGCTWS